ncbi:MAG: SDR family oxidoreductase [Alphaproteobacteria bacterium]|nr:SDR family oxidoreductase [Alphaproteobacteria bacterium]MDE2041444.1 SDR family oxidoreductase [Alphaproteobacteria bacterium]MDE2341753.1 SDR family oxidoreductase [Alphaproteobacteria bacterium]
MARLAGKIAIITGAAGGMGEAATLLFAREGAKVAAVDLDEARLAPVVEQIKAAGGTAIAIGADVSKTTDVERIVARTCAELGLPTVMFNNAGVDSEGKRCILDIDEAAFDKVVEINLKGVWLMIKHVAPKMIEAGGGSIVNTASIGAFVAASSAGYCASKAGVVGLTKAAAVELGRYNIRVNTLCPGATETPMARNQRAEMIAKGLPISNEIMDRLGVLGRMALPEEMAKMALFLASDDSSYATGADFINDAGWMAMCGVTVQPWSGGNHNRILKEYSDDDRHTFPRQGAPRRHQAEDRHPHSQFQRGTALGRPL